MYLGKFTYRDGGLVRMENGGPDPTKPYMYLDTKNNVNSWVRPPENPNQFVDWNRYQPAAVTNEVVIQGGKKVSPEEAARNKEYYRQEALKTPEGQEEERRRLMQEFVDQQNANKSPLQASLGNLSLDNPATRDAASNYAGYKMGQSSPMWATDRLLTGHDEPTTRDFYRPHESTLSFGIPAAIASAVSLSAAPAAGLAPAIGEGFNAVKTFAKPAVDAWNATLGTRLLGAAEMGASPAMQTAANLMTPANLLKTWGIYDLTHKYIPNAVEDINLYNETGDTQYLTDAAYNTGKGFLESFSHTGPIAKEVAAAKKPISFVDDARKMADTNRDAADRGVSAFKTFKNTMGYLKQQGGDISVPNLKRVKIKALPKNWKSQ